ANRHPDRLDRCLAAHAARPVGGGARRAGRAVGLPGGGDGGRPARLRAHRGPPHPLHGGGLRAHPHGGRRGPGARARHARGDARGDRARDARHPRGDARPRPRPPALPRGLGARRVDADRQPAGLPGRRAARVRRHRAAPGACL
ncbi:MAG: hypothetical protein AVDCRST_MAG30-4418, partial [uncultured Solirubrobacteraceae bacterium]